MYVTVILPLNLDRVLTYSVGESMCEDIGLGKRVIVPVGKSKLYTAIIIDILTSVPDSKITYKDIVSVVDTIPIIPSQQLRFWTWIASYYMCSLGDVMRSFLPKEFRIKGENVNDTISLEKSREVETYKIVSANSVTSTQLSELSRSPKQFALYNDILNFSKHSELELTYLSQIGYSAAIVRELLRKGFIEIAQKQRISTNTNQNTCLEVLPPPAQYDMDIAGQMLSNSVTLLYSTNGDFANLFGAIFQKLSKGENVLVMCVDVFAVKRFVKSISAFWGNNCLEYHSEMSDKQRFEVYKTASSCKSTLFVGTKISLTLPFDLLGMIVVLSEHDRAYKSDTTPRIVARDCATVLGKIYGANVVLQSDCPSIETYYNTRIGKYTLIDQKAHRAMPKISIINKFDIARGEKTYKYHSSDDRFFSNYLIEKIKQNTSEHKQTLLFKNQLGYSRFVICRHCGNVPTCVNCNTSLLYNKSKNQLFCPICSYVEPITDICPRCEMKELDFKGFGTENIEDKVLQYSQNSRTLRFDRESLKNKTLVRNAIQSIESNEIDVVIGTSLMLNSFDCSNVATSAIVDADAIINSTDFRAEERLFQLCESLYNSSKELIIQSYKTDIQILKYIASRDYLQMFETELENRRIFAYPPFVKLVNISIRHKDKLSVDTTANVFVERIIKHIPKDRINLSVPFVDKIKNEYIVSLQVKIFGDDNINMFKYYIKQNIEFFKNSKYFNNYKFLVDVDAK